MKIIIKNFLFILVVSVLFYSGCDLITPKPGINKPPSEKDLIISEVFTIPPDKFYAYSWIEIYNPTKKIINWFEFIQPANVFVVGTNGISLFTNDNAETWQDKSPTGIPDHIKKLNFNAVSFHTLNRGGAIVGDSGYIIRVFGDASGNFSFETITNPEFGKSLRDVQFSKTSDVLVKNGFAVGDSCTLLWTVDLGKTWYKYLDGPNPTHHNLNAISWEFVRFPRMVAVGDSGTILRSKKARIWEKLEIPEGFSDKNFYDVRLMADTGWIVGEDGSILFSKSGGQYWVKQDYPPSVTPRNLRSVYFDYELGQTGFIVGDNGVILKTTDFGTKWEFKESGTTADLNYVEFDDRYRGWAFGKNGTILSTEDGGETWALSKKGNDDFLCAWFAPVRNVEIRKNYVLEIYGKRKQFFFDQVTGTINFSIFTKVDTGYMIYDPTIFIQFGMFPEPIPPDRFGLVINDSIKFGNHHRLGPTSPKVYNFSIAYYYDSTAKPLPVRGVLWDLLNSGEIRLVKYSYTVERFPPPGRLLSEPRKDIIDIVRWGNFTVTDSAEYAMKTRQVHPSMVDRVFPYSGEQPYMQHQSAGFIPEWYSLSRYANDLGTLNPNELNTASSFYMAKDPLPGWYSQRKK